MQEGKLSILEAILYIIVLFALMIFMIDGYIPSSGEQILLVESIIVLIRLIAGVGLIFLGIFAKKDEEIRDVFSKVFMILVGIVIVIFTGYSAIQIMKDYNTSPQIYLLDSCELVKRDYRKRPDAYYLKGTCNGETYSFEITGTDEYTLSLLRGELYGAKVIAYPNSKFVITFEVFSDLKSYAENISLDTLKHCLAKPIDEEYGVNTLTLLAEDKEQDIALYGVQKYDRYGALVRIHDEVFFSSLFWNENNNQYLPEIRYKDIDHDGDNELLIQCFFEWESDARNVDLLIKTGEIYVCDNENGEWSIESFLSQDCSDALDDRIVLWFSQEGHLTLELDGQEIDNTDIPAEERNNYLYYGNFYMTGAEHYDLDNMTLTVKPFHYYEEMIDFVDIEFQMEYKDGKFSILEGTVLTE